MATIDDKIPNVIWPEKSGAYKVVQIRIEKNPNPYLRFGSIKDTHVNIWSKFMKENDYPFAKTIGAGDCTVNIKEKTAHFFGMSVGYGLWINQEHLESIKGISPDWEITP